MIQQQWHLTVNWSRHSSHETARAACDIRSAKSHMMEISADGSRERSTNPERERSRK
jgi:hypothetical protein